jgi:23S rRNA (pseudouridine1915-N3)-methyltransferase
MELNIMKITILTVGKIKEKFYTDAINEYAKRLSRYCKLEIVQVADEKTNENATENEMELIKRKEGDRLLKYIPEEAYVITLEIQGKSIDSVELAEKINQLGIGGTSHIIFVIGGSLGIHKAVSDRANYKLSFSKMTFPHQLMRVILLEQIYRSYRIIHNQPYHK